MRDIIYVSSHCFVSCNKDSVIFKNLIDKTKKYILFEEIEFIIFDHKKILFYKIDSKVC